MGHFQFGVALVVVVWFDIVVVSENFLVDEVFVGVKCAVSGLVGLDRDGSRICGGRRHGIVLLGEIPIVGGRMFLLLIL